MYRNLRRNPNLRVLSALAVVAVALTASRPASAAPPRRIVVTSTIQAAVDAAMPGDTVVVPPGTYAESVLVDKSGITIQGSRNAVLDARGFPNGITVGTGRITRPGGVPTCPPLALHDVVVQGLTVRNADRNGILLRGVDGFRVTGGTYSDNDRYGVFPVCSRNGVIDGNTVDGSNDAGIYVGNAHDVEVTGNRVIDCTIGVEIENTVGLVARGNILTGNTAGMLVFVLPNLPVPVTEDIAVTANVVRDNNRPNPAAPDSGQPEGVVPVGTGILAVGSDRVVVERNRVTGNDSIGIGVIRNPLAGLDPRVDPEPDGNHILANVVLGNGEKPDAIRTGGVGADLLYDAGGTQNCFARNVFRSAIPDDIETLLPCTQ